MAASVRPASGDEDYALAPASSAGGSSAEVEVAGGDPWELHAMRVACSAASCAQLIERRDRGAAIAAFTEFLGGLLTLESDKAFQDDGVRRMAFKRLWTEEARLRRRLGLAPTRR